MDAKSQVSAIEELQKLLPEGCVTTDPDELSYFSQDYFRRGTEAIAVVAPRTLNELSQAVATATERGIAVFPRGAGYSYTDAYTPTQPGITVDLRQMNAVVEINAEDMYVTVEPGCTWASLNDALASSGLRTPFWGPFSGLRTTVGGAISQGALSWGSSTYGLSSASVVDMQVVIADGSVIHTGTSGQEGHAPFFRNYGPDLTGLYCCDCGALGIKSAISLRLIRRPRHSLGLSFGFQSFEAGARAAIRVAREGVASESFGMYQERAVAAVSGRSLKDDLSALWKIGKSGSGLLDGARRMARVAVAGRRFLDAAPLTYHFNVEAENRTTIDGLATTVRDAVGRDGVEIANTIPTAARADPFIEYDMLSFTGQRQVPPSTILPLSRVEVFHHAFIAAVGALEAEMKKHNMSVTAALATVGTNGFLYEPVIAWDDAPDEFHRRHTSDALLEVAGRNETNREARALAESIRQVMIDLSFEHGGVHLQIGKVYPYLKERDANAVALLEAIKKQVDPHNLMNPGALGLPVQRKKSA